MEKKLIFDRHLPKPELIFKCKHCGSTELYVERESAIKKEYVDTLECTCKLSNEFAAQRIYTVTTRYQERMELEDYHRIGQVFDEVENLGSEKEEIGYDVGCCVCYEDGEEVWSTKMKSSEIEEDSIEVYVRCTGCDQEIEFGWSHPGRGGRVWPAKCSGFNPWLCWPEPRYYDKWIEKGWIRPDLIDKR